MDKYILFFISTSQLLIAATQIIIAKRLDKMPNRLAWECSNIAESEKRWAKKWREKYEAALKEIAKLQEELLSAADIEGREGDKESSESQNEIDF